MTDAPTAPTEPDDWIVDEIDQALNRCRTIQEVNATWTHYLTDLNQLKNSKFAERRTRYILLFNLQKYMKERINDGTFAHERTLQGSLL